MTRFPDTFELLHYIGAVKNGTVPADWHILGWCE